ncbi:MAG: LytTR family DNA-binding domain-containing protein [Bacteroidota bacterium]
MQAVIIEDEKNSQELLKELVEQYCAPLKVAAIAGGVKEGLAAIKTHQPDILFLDIELPDGDGFQVLEQQEDISFDVIFTTAYDQYAMKAFKFSAADYLLKPVDIEELQAAVKRIVDKRSSSDDGIDTDKLKALINNIRHQDKSYKKIVLPTSNGFTVVDPKDIIRCESDRNYTYIFLNDKRRILVSRTIKEYEEMLRDFNFFRIHQSHLINLDYLKNYIRGRGGYVELSDGSTLDVSARRKSEFLKRMSYDS